MDRVADAPPATVAGLPVHRLQAADGAQAVVSPFGAQLLSWRPAGGDERLYLSPRALLDGSGPIRGGVPLVFPQFANLGPLPAHGLLRQRVWAVASASDDEVVFSLQDDETGRALWPHSFEARFGVRLDGAALVMRLSITNRGSQTFSFQAALHTYLRVHDLAALRVRGLGGARYLDRADGGREGPQAEPELALIGDADRIYPAAPADITLRESAQALKVHLAGGFQDLVVWNPGAERGAHIADLPPDGFQHFVCAEAACIVSPAELSQGQTWWGEQGLTVADPRV